MLNRSDKFEFRTLKVLSIYAAYISFLTANGRVSWFEDHRQSSQNHPHTQWLPRWVHHQRTAVHLNFFELYNFSFIWNYVTIFYFNILFILNLHFTWLSITEWFITFVYFCILFLHRFGFKCSVCLLDLSEPTSLPCEHVFCLSCLRRSTEREDSKYCPKCRAPLSNNYRPIVSTTIEWV